MSYDFLGGTYYCIAQMLAACCHQTPESSQMLRNDHKSFIYTLERNEVELNLVFAYSAPVSPKSMVATFEWNPRDETIDKKLNLTWSDALKSYFAYAPKADHAGLREGTSIIVPGPGWLEIRLYNWPSKSPAPNHLVSGLYAGMRASGTGAVFTGLQRIHENETKA
jgi:hypothetical protein